MFKVEILADSICPDSASPNSRLTSFLVTYPRIILAEINTHKMISKNTGSSRAVPVERKAAEILDDPWMPLTWQRKAKGMQGQGTIQALDEAVRIVNEFIRVCVETSCALDRLELAKQYANRFHETVSWTSTILTSTEWANFFFLRCSEFSQPEFDELAGLMLQAYVDNKPAILSPGQWHVPFGDRVEPEELSNLIQIKFYDQVKALFRNMNSNERNKLIDIEAADIGRLLVSASRCGRLSYERHNGEFTLESDIEKGLEHVRNRHSSVFEHQGRPIMIDFRQSFHESVTQGLIENNRLWDGKNFWSANFKGWDQFRKFFKEEAATTMDPQALLEAWRIRRKARGYNV